MKTKYLTTEQEIIELINDLSILFSIETDMDNKDFTISSNNNNFTLPLEIKKVEEDKYFILLYFNGGFLECNKINKAININIF